jgi:transmembrane sensor
MKTLIQELMEKFDQKIKERLASYPTNESPSASEVAKMMSLLAEALPHDSKIIPINPTAEVKFMSSSWLKIAAAFIAFVVASFTAYQVAEVNIESGDSGLTTVELPDHSVIKMKENSKVEYNRITWIFNRTLSFIGEGYFEVEKGEQFTVLSKLGSIQVLGTSFTIYSRENTYEVACFTGKVSVASNTSSEEIVLKPGDAVILKTESFIPYQLPTTEKPSWVEGEFYFEDEDFINVIEALEKQYQVEVSFPEEFETLKYTGYFDNTNLEKALKLVCEPLELTYEIKGKTIQLNP